MRLDNALSINPSAYQIMCELYDWLAAGGDEDCAFDYKLWHSDFYKDKPACGTAACIGGKLEADLFHGVSTSRPWTEIASKAGIPQDEADKLFFNAPVKVSPKVAAICVRNLMRDGQTNWWLASIEAEADAQKETVAA